MPRNLNVFMKDSFENYVQCRYRTTTLGEYLYMWKVILKLE